MAPDVTTRTPTQFRLRPKTMLGLPWQKQTNPLTALCVAQLYERRTMSMCMVHGDAFVAHSRNRIADAFLASKCEYLFFIDDDMVLPFGDAAWYNANSDFNLVEPYASLHALDRLMSHQKTLVGGLYFGRYPTGAPMYGEGMNGQEADRARTAPFDEVKPTRWVGTGCMLIHRSVFEDIEKEFPKLARGANGYGSQFFSTSEHKLFSDVERVRAGMADGAMTGEKCVAAYAQIEKALASARRNSSLGMGEDVQFCIRASQAGHQPHVDMGLLCGHMGGVVYGAHNTRKKDASSSITRKPS